MSSLIRHALWVFNLFITTVYGQALPYNPTTILLSSNLAYVFIQNTAADHLQAINISSVVSASNATFEVVTQNLPFETNGSSAFIPSISVTGEISVYTGDCSTSTSAELWTYSSGRWIEGKTTTASGIEAVDLPGANFLSRSLSFSDYVYGNASQTKVYVFGGMCPESGTDISAWQSNATYSNQMLRLEPEASSYTLDLSQSRGPPIAEAGFTITGLTPTYSNSTGIETQSQNFVLLGGHTQTAFINMSLVAIWSLPEESWSFISIDTPISSANTELAVKSVDTTVDSRSGHTSVLSEDGTKLIVYGGWVGDITQAADPQLAILEVGTGFGGEGDWKWSVPAEQPSGSSIYGHGAVMLPGNVMMVVGGYSISESGNAKRDADSESTPMFFNVSNLSWNSQYTNPAYVAATAASIAQSSSSKTSTAKSKLTLALSLGLGLTALLIIIGVVVCYSRRLKHNREDEREKHIQSLSAATAIEYTPTSGMGQRGGSFPWANNRWSRADDDDIIHGPAMAEYEEIQGVADNISVPPRQISRKPVRTRSSRGAYQPAPSNGYTTFGFNGHNRNNSLGTAGPIHPIYEADEDDSRPIAITFGRDSEVIATSATLNRRSDPFRDQPTISPRRYRDDSESPSRSREREIQEWVSDWAAADTMLSSQARIYSSAGRVSPIRRAHIIAASNAGSVSGEDDSGRTASSLSERSVAISAMAVSRSDSSSHGRSRNNSLRGFITNAISPFTALSTTVATSISPAPDARAGSPSSSGENSFNTAHTSFGRLQAEAEGLLPRLEDEYSSREQSPVRSPRRYSLREPGSPSKSKSIFLGRRGGWLGSIRRALAGEHSSSTYPSPSATFDNRGPSPICVGRPTGDLPRRAASAGAMLWRRKQGKSDWEDSAELDAGRPNTFTGEMRLSEDSDEWDVERAVQNRVVQVMFTVPKEKLRVVNHDFADEDNSEVGSIRNKKGSGRLIKDSENMELFIETDSLGEACREPLHSTKEKVTGTPKVKGKVRELVEDFEWRSSPDRSPERSPEISPDRSLR
ncbi:hypothetical protein BJ878DRAFT_415432 [Calycina marina]|uniref:Galactose oxidase n=1 Tax=Calycina marina TaxID=1763456 RepID=A0A9P7Z8E5_9HELO|nr:hypothetical protein BJ878DRAFT_415432 [Calycina marina]